MKKTIILAIALLTWCSIAVAQSYVQVGDESFKRTTYNKELLKALNEKGEQGYKLVQRKYHQPVETKSGVFENVFLMEKQEGKKFEYVLVGDESYKNAPD